MLYILYKDTDNVLCIITNSTQDSTTTLHGGKGMNIIHMKYAVEVARIGSINKAAEELLIAQPNLSRSIKELEADLGITIFSRTSKGMTLTPEGEEFIGYARKILDQIDDVESIYRKGVPKKQKFSISVPRASYISEAFAEFSPRYRQYPRIELQSGYNTVRFGLRQVFQALAGGKGTGVRAYR